MYKLKSMEFEVICPPTQAITFNKLMLKFIESLLDKKESQNIELGFSDDPGPVAMDNGDIVIIHLHNATAMERQYRYIVIPKNNDRNPFEGMMVLRIM